MYAVATAAQESKEWQAEIDKISNQFSITANDFSIGLGTQSRMFLDFAIRRLKDNPEAANNVTQLVKEKKFILALKAFQKLQEANPLGRIPEIGQANPSSLPIKWTKRDEFKVDNDYRIIRFNGWDIPLEQSSELRAEIRDQNDKPLRDVSRYIKASTRYDATMDVSRGGIRFEETDRTILVTFQKKMIAQVQITWGERPGPPPPTIDRVIFRIRTLNNNKEGNGRIFLEFLDRSGAVLLKRGPFGEREDWKEGDGGNDGTKRAFGLPDSEEGRFAARIPTPPGSQFTARIRLEKAFNSDIFNDAVWWNCSWIVILQHWNGSSYDELGTYSGSREFKAGGTDVGDVNITR
jgi:hypothetical protein